MGVTGEIVTPESMVWHDEADRLDVWGTLDPLDACMCRECILGEDSGSSDGEVDRG